jgi:chorismate lyase/3-hydroxybenzoate synthase
MTHALPSAARRPAAAGGCEATVRLAAEYVDAAAPEVPAPDAADTLLVVNFDAACAGHGPGSVSVPLRQLQARPRIEVWRGAGPVRRERAGDVWLSWEERFAFASVCLQAGGSAAGDAAGGQAFAAAVTGAYRSLYAEVRRRGFPFVCRVWNYFEEINGAGPDGLERYRAFSRARHAGLGDLGATAPETLPAACAIGTRAPGLLVFVLAGKAPAAQIENPRQVSAFRYPVEYGPRSPSFSRSVLLPMARDRRALLVSGTASIVGHASRHVGDAAAQADEALRNLDALLGAAAARAGRTLSFRTLKAYARHAAHAPMLAEKIARAFGAHVPLVVLEADICRRELLVEIEGMAEDDR